jgi:hypothetical protein
MPEGNAARARPTAEHERLGAFVGKWNTEGTIHAMHGAPAAKMYATDIYEWVSGEFFLVHRWNAHMPDGETGGIEITGYDATTGTYPMHSYDNQGNMTVMHASVQGDTWMFVGESLRFTGGFQDGGRTFAGLWEQKAKVSKTWQPWMDMTLTKVE